MFLTAFYMAASWVRARKLNYIRRKIIDLTNKNSTVTFYRVTGRDVELSISPTSSTFCVNRLQGTVNDVLYYENDIRACALAPKQIVDVSNWISFAEGEISPIQLNNVVPTLEGDRFFLLFEADCIEVPHSRDETLFCLNEVGVPRAWRLNDALGVIVESDLEHITKVFAGFTTEHMYVDLCFEVRRIQTVAIKGKPCVLVHEVMSRSDSMDDDFGGSGATGGSNANPLTTTSNWKQHINMFRTYSNCGDGAAAGDPVQVPGFEYTSVAPANNILELESPYLTSLNIGEIESNRVDNDSSDCGLSREIRISSQDDQADLSQRTSTSSSNHSTPSKLDLGKKNIFSSLHSLASASTASVHSQDSSTEKPKPPNVLIFAESQTTVENIKALLTETLHKHKYTIYSVTESQLINSLWTSNCKLLVIGGNVPRRIEPLLISYYVRGGKMFCLCSSFLHTVIPFFRTAEIRERELVYFSYKKWIRVPLLHSVFCYHKSTSKQNFSNGAEEKPDDERCQTSDNAETFLASTARDRIVFADPEGGVNQTRLTVLGYEETWQNSSLLLCESEASHPPVERPERGVIIMSQVHLELGAVEGLEHEGILRKSEILRKEIVRDIFSEYLKMEVAEETQCTLDYTCAYFLGMHDAKIRFIEQMRYSMRDGILRVGPMEMKFIGHDEEGPKPSRYTLPIYMYRCPGNFSTLEYFETLRSLYVGRLVIYAEVLASSMDLVNADLANGLAVVVTQQTAGKGRSSNQWLSPPGCTMFSLQLHFPLDSYLGSHPTILQHIVAIAVVSALSEMSTDHKMALDLHLKWPNDIYHGNSVKLGGLIATCLQSRNNIIVNIGCGINLNNGVPTTCLNKLIKQYNEKNNTKVPELSREVLLAKVFTEVERIIAVAQGGQMHIVKHMYYNHWLHSGARIRIRDHSSEELMVSVRGIDEYGFLEVRDDMDNVFSVQPDGNTFDMMEGLIAPKTR